MDYINTKINLPLTLQHIADVMHVYKDRATHFFIEHLRTHFYNKFCGCALAKYKLQLCIKT